MLLARREGCGDRQRSFRVDTGAAKDARRKHARSAVQSSVTVARSRRPLWRHKRALTGSYLSSYDVTTDRPTPARGALLSEQDKPLVKACYGSLRDMPSYIATERKRQ